MKKKLAAAVAALSISVADAQLNTVYEGTVTRIIDADTQEAVISLFPGIQTTVSIRSLGIDTPEIRRPSKQCAVEEKALAIEAKSYVESIIPVGSKIRISNVGLGKYAGRVLGQIYFQSDGEWLSLSQDLINREYAVKYQGGTKINWCERF